MERKKINIFDNVLIGEWEEVKNIEASTITKNDKDTEKLNGLILKGYETKFANNTNENGERYTKECLDEFINRYFIGNGLNMPVTIQHRDDIDSLAGRVIYAEVNTTGFYFVAYIPKSYYRYGQVRTLLQEGILQGFSKEGWASDYEFIYKKNGEFDYMLIKKMEIVSMSIVATPANAVTFEQMKEVANGLRFENKTIEDNKKTDLFGFEIDK